MGHMHKPCVHKSHVHTSSSVKGERVHVYVHSLTAVMISDELTCFSGQKFGSRSEERAIKLGIS